LLRLPSAHRERAKLARLGEERSLQTTGIGSIAAFLESSLNIYSWGIELWWIRKTTAKTTGRTTKQ
jgi:hypothetical protein